MTYFKGVLTGILVTLLCLGACALAWWLVNQRPAEVAKPAHAKPATMASVLKEEQINTIVLTQEAVDRLAIATARVERKPMPRTRVYGGEIAIPLGRSIVVSAPVGGMLQVATQGLIQAGQKIKKGQVVFQLLPLLTPEGRANLAAASIESEGQVKSAQTQMQASLIALDRARRVFQSDAGSRKAVDDAQAQFDLDQKALEAATARRSLFLRIVGEADRGTAAPISIDSPADGVLRNVAALPGQTVASGGVLFEVADLTRVWVRVPVFVGDLEDLATTRGVLVGPLNAAPGSIPSYAELAAAPPSANAATATVDHYYVLPNDEDKVGHVVATAALGLAPTRPFAAAGALLVGKQPPLSPGQRVGVAMPLRGERTSLVVPWSAVIHDVHGGTWVYEQTAVRTYARRRVVVRDVANGFAALVSGPEPGAAVVTAGAAELFGAETGFTK